MPYIGTPAVDSFVASKAASVFSGDGSTTAFTLDHAVGSDEDILVSVDGVIQEPSVAYAVSNGTTLTFTAAPSSNSGNNIFVYYLFRTVGTVGHPSNQALSASTGTFTGDVTVDTDTLKVDATNDKVGVNTASPSDPLHVTASSGSRIARFEASQANSFIAFKDSNTNVMPTIGCTTDALELKTASSGDPALGLKIDANGHVTKPLQTAFLATPSTNQNDMSNSGNVTVVFGNEVYDQNSDFASNTFTAPVDGKYFLSLSLYLLNVDSAAGYYQITIDTSNRDYFHLFDPNYSADLTYYGVNMGVVADMDANDTAFIRFNQNSGSAQTDINTDARFMGYLLG